MKILTENKRIYITYCVLLIITHNLIKATPLLCKCSSKLSPLDATFPCMAAQSPSYRGGLQP